MLMLEGCRRSHPIFWCTPLICLQWTVVAMRDVNVMVSDSAPHFDSQEAEAVDLGEFDVVWLRKDPPFDIGYIFSTYMLDLVPGSTLVLNHPASIRDANEKMVALRYPEVVPPTLVTCEIDRALAWIAKAPAKVVLKPWDGNGGRGVLISQHGDEIFGACSSCLQITNAFTFGSASHS